MVWRCGAVGLAIWATWEIVRFRIPTCAGCNVILVSVDTLRADHLGCYGYRRATSPAIDRLAQRSLLFERAYSASAWTQPGHMAMLSGRYPIRQSELEFSSARPFSDSYELLSEVLRQSGYSTTALIGGGYVGSHLGFARGFDTFRGPKRNLRDMTDPLVSWLDRRDPRRPFFLFLHGYDMHEPYSPPADLQLRFIDEVPPACRGVTLRCAVKDGPCRHGPGGREYLVAQYDALIVGVDRFINRLVSELERRGLLERTIVVLTADHGERLMDRGTRACGHMGDLDEAVFRVPLIVYVPRLVGRRVAQRVSLVDLAPTLLDILALRPLATSHGRSLIAGLEDGAGDRIVYGATGSDPGSFVLAVIDGGGKLVKSRANRTGRWRYALYDLDRDPQGAIDVLPAVGPPPPQYFDLLAKLEGWQSDIAFEIDGQVSSPPPALPPGVVEQLRELGYVP